MVQEEVIKRPIPFVDLQKQSENLSEEIFAAIRELSRTAAFSEGPFTERFESEFASFLSVEFFAGVSSGSDALFLSLKALGIRPGDEVILPANTFIATAFAPLRIGAVPVFADCDPLTWQADPVSVEKKISPKTRAVIGVHLYGQAFPVNELRGLADSYDLKLIEDCAQAQGTLYYGKAAGTLSDAGCFSFYPTKNLGAWGQAGGVSCKNADVDHMIRVMRSQGAEERYRHDVPGYNMRLDSVQAAVLSVKLRYLKQWNERRAQIVNRYRQEINNPAIRFQAELPYTQPAWYLAVVCVDGRERFLSFLKERNINCGIHYPIPCHLQPALSDFGYRLGDFPCSEYQAGHCVSLPLFPELSETDISRVVDACNEFVI